MARTVRDGLGLSEPEAWSYGSQLSAGVSPEPGVSEVCLGLEQTHR